MTYSLSNLKPSDVRRIERDIGDAEAKLQLIEEVEKFIGNSRTSIADLDYAWCTGVELSKIVRDLDYTKTGTKACAAFAAGVEGKSFSEFLKNE